ncbi:MBOAT family O-acyltransferase [Varibaculum vaginae]|uniref:MBOAT family O-acyltransferase n=1 Tax=Varibaculum vaginae TaxID=2364797 RepID=UPI00190F1AF8|nr:MBOAT family protein [Varibaculum vaginae]
MLILASLLFYSYGEPIYVLLMLVSCLANWGLALALDTRKEGAVPAKRKAILTLALVLNLGVLGFFKYAGMFLGTIDSLLGLDLKIGAVALPIGISFYTFQALSYVIDVYRGKISAARDPLVVMLYISFFPQLIAGPIVRYRHIEQQIAQRFLTLNGVACGMRRFVIGLSKKVIIADSLAVVVDGIYGNQSGQVDFYAAWLAAICYALQIYFDFSGYSDMAIGMAAMFGFQFQENFTYPYISRTMQEFWHRWHISLSTWFLEYLYIPLGGNRKGEARTVINKFTVFMLCGLWHGAAWTFVAWGLFHGIFLILEEIVPLKKLPHWAGHLYTMLVVVVSFVVFRADSFSQALQIYAKMFGVNPDSSLPAGALALSYLDPWTLTIFFTALIAMLPVTQILAPQAKLWKKLGITNPPSTYTPALVDTRIWNLLLTLALLAANLLLLAAGGYHPFIYFRF